MNPEITDVKPTYKYGCEMLEFTETLLGETVRLRIVRGVANSGTILGCRTDLTAGWRDTRRWYVNEDTYAAGDDLFFGWRKAGFSLLPNTAGWAEAVVQLGYHGLAPFLPTQAVWDSLKPGFSPAAA